MATITEKHYQELKREIGSLRKKLDKTDDSNPESKEWHRLQRIGHSYHCACGMACFGRKCECGYDFRRNNPLSRPDFYGDNDCSDEEFQSEIYAVEDAIPFIRKTRIT